MDPKKEYIITIDQSTSASKVMLFNKKGKPVERITLPHQQYYPAPGYVEHDPMEIFQNVCEGIARLMSKCKITEDQLAGLAITNQRETAMIWDGETGLPVANAVVWQCQRGEGYCNELKGKGYSGMVSEKTGLIIDPYFSASKLHWLMKHTPGLKEKAEKGHLLAGTMDSWLLWKLSGGKVHATDYSNACRTLLLNIKTLQWDDELIALFGLNKNMLPEVRFSDEIFGWTDPNVIFNSPVPISGLMGDSHAALFGQNCFSPGMGKATYGTGSSIMMNIGHDMAVAPEGLVTSIGFGLDRRIHYVFEGNIHCTGDTINWLKNELQLIKEAAETESLATEVDDTNGVYFVPAFVGLGAPYWDNQARASISGMSRNTNRAHIARAALESIAYQVKDLIELMEQKEDIELSELRADGGPTRNSFLMQFQSDILDRKVVSSDIEEVSALGATFMAGLATGFWKDLDEIKNLRESTRMYVPAMSEEERGSLYKGWKKAVERTRM